MAFKSIAQAKAEKNAGRFVLENDGDSADVVFLYRSQDEFIKPDYGAHYIKSEMYNGYIHCNGAGCAACGKGKKVQDKLFVPMYVLAINGQPVNEIQFWDRSMKFEPVLSQAIFKNYANPSEFVFRITRNGAHGDIKTTYTIQVAFKNTTEPFDKILADNNAVFPDYYSNIIKEVDNATLNQWLASANSANTAANTDLPEYVATPRVSVAQNTQINGIDTLIEVEDEFDDNEELDETTDF